MEKLVRDRIPEIILESTGKMPETRVLNDVDYKNALDNKLREEVGEYFASGDIEELADITEVVLAIVKTKGMSRNKFEKVRVKKGKENGRFNKKILLESI